MESASLAPIVDGDAGERLVHGANGHPVPIPRLSRRIGGEGWTLFKPRHHDQVTDSSQRGSLLSATYCYTTLSPDGLSTAGSATTLIVLLPLGVRRSECDLDESAASAQDAAWRHREAAGKNLTKTLVRFSPLLNAKGHSSNPSSTPPLAALIHGNTKQRERESGSTCRFAVRDATDCLPRAASPSRRRTHSPNAATKTIPPLTSTDPHIRNNR